MRIFAITTIGVVLAILPGCNRAKVASASEPASEVAGTVASADNTAAAAAAVPADAAPAVAPAPAPAPRAAPAPLELAPGSTVRVRLLQTIDTQRNRPGDRFEATLDEPLVSGDRVIVPKGTRFIGHVTEAKRSGRFKGRAVLALSLDSFVMRGRTIPVRTTSAARVSGGHKKRNWLWLGGGSAGGALIGAAASGGTGALIGSGAGAAAGTVGMLFTGRKDVRLPVESAVTFTIQARVNLS